MSLAVKDILLLDYFSGKPIHSRMPKYLESTYGLQADERIRRLMDEGWIRQSVPKETLSLLPDKALSDFLLRYGLDGTGDHSTLVKRIVGHIAEKDYAHTVPKVYVLEAKGRAVVGHHMAYILNARENYGLAEGDIGDAQKNLQSKGLSYNAGDVLKLAFQQKINIYILAGEWSKLRNLYYLMANFYIRRNEEKDALSHLFLVFLIDMSGMGNKNTVIPYENLFPTQKGMILLIDEIRHRLNMTMDDVKSAFLVTLARMAPRLPFSYFSPQVMGVQLLERLRGIPFNGAKYITDKNTPDSSAGAYKYVPWGRSEGNKESAVPSFTQPKVMAPPVLRMPAFTMPEPFISSEEREKLRRQEEKRQKEICKEDTVTAQKESKVTMFHKWKKWIK